MTPFLIIHFSIFMLTAVTIAFVVIAYHYADKAGKLSSEKMLDKDQIAMLRRSLTKERGTNRHLSVELINKGNTVRRYEDKMLDMARELGQQDRKIAKLEQGDKGTGHERFYAIARDLFAVYAKETKTLTVYRRQTGALTTSHVGQPED